MVGPSVDDTTRAVALAAGRPQPHGGDRREEQISPGEHTPVPRAFSLDERGLPAPWPRPFELGEDEAPFFHSQRAGPRAAFEKLAHEFLEHRGEYGLTRPVLRRRISVVPEAASHSPGRGRHQRPSMPPPQQGTAPARRSSPRFLPKDGASATCRTGVSGLGDDVALAVRNVSADGLCLALK